MADPFILDANTIETLVNQAIQTKVIETVNQLVADPNWRTRVEKILSQTVVQETVSRIGSIDINSIIHERIDENAKVFRQGFKGIDDKATQIQLTAMDEHVVVENTLVARELKVVDGATIRHLAVTGSINTDNEAWNLLAQTISDKTLINLTDKWRDQLVASVTEQIHNNGISFDNVQISGTPLVAGSALSSAITESSLQKIGTLNSLRVSGEASLYDTLLVVNGRVGINSDSPEMALSVWDEEVSINIGKFKDGQAYIGTSRAQGLTLGVNRTAQIDIDVNGLTTIKKLRVGQHSISHAVEVPGWHGTRGDIVFNASPKDDDVFAWVCLGDYRWKTLKSA